MQWHLISLTAALAFLLAAPGQAAQGDKKPNVLFLFADDMTFDAIGALGHSEIETPNLDRLVRRGTVFTRAYNQGSWTGAVCVASRTMLITGRFLWDAHEIYNRTDAERQAGRFWPAYMRQAGYETYFTGKWHIKTDAARAFDVAQHVRGGMPQQTPQGYNRPLEGEPDPWSPSDPRFGGFWEGGRHWSEVVADDAVSFLERASGREAPYFMYIAFNAPHDPRQSPQEYVDRYPLEEIAVPESFVPEYPHKDAIGCGEKQRDESLAPFPRTEHAVRTHRQEYYAIISHMDAQIRRILDGLQRSGTAGNTWIFFSADHGLACGKHGLMGKQNMFDHSVRVPLIVVGPGVPTGEAIHTPVYLQDIMPTTLELGGVERPDHVQFRSLLPLLRGERDQQYDAIYGAYLDLQRSVTEGDYKLIEYPTINKTLLYNVNRDPQELRNLADDPEHQQTVRRLRKTLRELQREMDDPLVTNAGAQTE